MRTRASCALDLQIRPVHKVAMIYRGQGWSPVGVAVAVSVALVLASCAASQRGAKTPPPPPPTPTPVSAAQPPSVYYAGVEGLKVYSQPSTRSKVVGVLALHEKVSRVKLERGYAYVESTKRDLKGWVTNARLVWRLPTTPTTGAPAPVEAQPEEPVAPTGEEPQAPVTPEATATAAEPLPTPTNSPVPVRPKSQATPGGVAPSIFNPY